MEVPIYKDGKTDRTEVDPSFLGEKVKTRTLRAAILMYEANKRVGTHKVKTRSEIARSKRQLFKQKGLGRGRVRHPQVSQCRGGGVAHGPGVRDYSYRMPRKSLRVALRSALLSKFRDGEVALVDGFSLDRPRTRDLKIMLDQLGCTESCLVVDCTPDSNLVLSARNLQRVEVKSTQDLNAYDVLFHRNLVLTPAALEAIKEAHGNG